MSFPCYKKGWFFTHPDGWEDRGLTNNVIKVDQPEGTVTYISCCTCKNRVRVGREDGHPFLYCPICLIKVNPPSANE
jgi:hypothetical protein